VGAVHRTGDIHLAAGGKGMNVTRAALTLGYEILATAPLAGHTGQLMADLATAEGLPVDWYWQETGETRNCILINHDTGDTTVINEAGSRMSSVDWLGFADHVERLARRAQVVTFSGSVLPGVEPAALGELARSLAVERTVYLDSSGTTLSAALAQPNGLCFKVNRSELVQGLALEPDQLSDESLLDAGKRLLERGAALVVVTLGGEGALAIAPEGCWRIDAPSVPVVSTVGSGDCLLTGLAVARLAGQSLTTALAQGVACGAANAMTRLPGRFERAVAESLRSGITPTKIAAV
jgi:1-phosphofructokinase family hexose kinase